MTNVKKSPIIALWAVACALSAIAVFSLWQDHRPHLSSALSFAFLLACPLLHLFLHGRHKHREGGADGERTHQHGAV